MFNFARNHPFLVLLLGLSLLTTAPATTAFVRLLDGPGHDLSSIPLVTLFSALFFWISFSFWTATLGFLVRLRRRFAPSAPPPRAGPREALAKTAVVMPVYNEDPAQTLSALLAMRECLLRTRHAGSFEFFMLSDSIDPDIWLREEIAWAELAHGGRGPCPIFYRRRARNTGSKSGNIGDFCKKWGRHYTFMVLLDADSIMAADTLIEMVRRIQADPELGILQSPPVPINRGSLFARLQQFAASVYGPMWASGYALWCGPNGNYWGHNAIIRVSAFLACCGLPRLAGRPPLGGEIMSHDFVEAALMRRAGWTVRLADDLGGSYEECPTNLITYAKRDQRWCQGNLQHLRLLLAPGLHPLSRVHLAMGAMSYLASPLWLLLMVLGLMTAATRRSADGSATDMESAGQGVLLYGLTMGLLLAPRLWAYILLLLEPARLRPRGGAARVAASVLLETLFSVLLAPILMLAQSLFVAAALLGRTVRWDAQSRSEEHIRLRQAWRAHRGHMAAGLLATASVLWLTPALLGWMAPVLAGAVLSVPLSIVLSSARAGCRLREWGLLLIPEETHLPALVRRKEHYLNQTSAAMAGPDPFIRVVLDPALNEVHNSLLSGSDAEGSAPAGRSLRRVALYGGPSWLSSTQKLVLLSDARAMRWLHHAAWRRWPQRILDDTARASA